MDYGRITPLTVKAVQDIASLSASFKQTLIAWLADAQNGIENLFAKNLYATNVTADTGTFRTLTASSTSADTTSANRVIATEVCAGDTPNDPNPVCVTKAQLAALLSQSAAAATPISVPSAPFNIREPEPPISVSSTSSAEEVATSTTEALPLAPANDNAPADPASPVLENDNPPPAGAPSSQAANF